MKLILILILCLFGNKFIKYLFNKFILFLFILSISIGITFVYKIPYKISIFLIFVLIYTFYSVLSQLKIIKFKIFKSRKLYLNGWYEKLVDLLFSLNYITLIILSYIVLTKFSFTFMDIYKLSISFFVTWISLWIIGHSENFLLKIIRCNKY